MALLASEMQRLRFECGYNVLGVGAEPYISYIALFDQVVKVYLNAGATTTSTTAVFAATTPTPSTITLASATGFAAKDIIVVDVDSRQEKATIQAVSGSTITALLTLAHDGMYPVTQEGGESIVRDLLRTIGDVKTKLFKASSSTGLKRVEDVEWYPGLRQGSAVIDTLQDMLMFWRDELCAAVGVPNMWRMRSGANSSIAAY